MTDEAIKNVLGEYAFACAGKGPMPEPKELAAALHALGVVKINVGYTRK